MNSTYINPFLQSSITVIEQMCRLRPSLGELQLKNIMEEEQALIRYQIKVKGELEGEIVYSFSESVALRIVSEMMGGMTVTQLDEIGQSAISELGNMISGNASSILFSQGVSIDITPPGPFDENEHKKGAKSLKIPLHFEDIGDLSIFVNFRQAG